MSRAADITEQAKAHGLKTAVSPGRRRDPSKCAPPSRRRADAVTEGHINGVVPGNACGPCIGQWRRAKEASEVPNTIVTSYNRNFPRRNDGQPTTMNFIGSPEIVTALALAGRLSFNPLTDSLTGADGKAFKLSPPKTAPEVPARNFDRGRPTYVALRRTGGDICRSILGASGSS